MRAGVVVMVVLLGCGGGRPTRVGGGVDTGDDDSADDKDGGDDSADTDGAVDSGDDTAGDSDTSDSGDSDAVDTDALALGPCTRPGFEPKAALWTLPPVELPAGHELRDTTVSATCPSPGGSAEVISLDVDGDGRLDLVQADVCADDFVGTAYWKVYRNTGTGYATTPTTVPLPDFDAPVETSVSRVFHGRCEVGSNGLLVGRYEDVDADGKVDILVTDHCTLTDVGISRWLLYRGTGTGFAAPQDLGLPSLAGTMDQPFRVLRSALSTACAVGNVWSDLTYRPSGPHLVVTRVCSANEPGASVWWEYPLQGSTFAGNPQVISAPPEIAAVMRVERTDGPMYECSDGASYTLTRMDLDGDGDADLVAGDICKEATSGGDHVTWWPREAGGFPGPGRTWSLPSGLRETTLEPLRTVGTFIQGCTDGERLIQTAVRDMTGDGLPDLVVTRNCDTTSGVGVDHWLVYPASGGAWVGPPLRVDVPALGPTFPELAYAKFNIACPDRPGTGALSGSLIDLDGDGLQDLVFHRYCDDTSVGTSTWRVHKGVCLP
ncbi:MAG: VCBS repeat-containing protein [Alphaproteobacteria bacterium]|nr:VCBS repeat-containing protein [Alphaproteobacteria bacterium]